MFVVLVCVVGDGMFWWGWNVYVVMECVSSDGVCLWYVVAMGIIHHTDRVCLC